MAMPHAKSGDVIDVRPLGPTFAAARSVTLVKSDSLEVIRLVVPTTKEIAPHKTKGEVAIHCLEGSVGILVNGVTQILEAGQLMYLAAGELHAVRGMTDASLLVTILLRESPAASGRL
jgi:quercetin dioxygenase-like cupin family protein